MRNQIALLLLALLLLSSQAHATPERIGYVKTVSGTAMVTSAADGTTRSISLLMPIYEEDRVETGRDGEVGITFRDDTRITLGPNSRIELSHFLFEPAQRQYGLVMRLVYGTLQYLSGLTEKLAPDAVSIETPGSTIAVRGTRLLIRIAKAS